MRSNIKSFHPSGCPIKLTNMHVHTHTHTRALRGSIHLCNSACTGYVRGNLLITPSVVSQSTHTPIHQHTPICQSHSLLLVSRVLQFWEFVNSRVHASVLYMCVQACKCACILCVSVHILLYVRVGGKKSPIYVCVGALHTSAAGCLCLFVHL